MSIDYKNDPVLKAARAYLDSKQTTLWADWDITRPDRKETAARWLAAQVYGLSEFYREPGEPKPGPGVEVYQGPYSAERGGGGLRPDTKAGTGAGAGRPSALITAGQQPEQW